MDIDLSKAPDGATYYGSNDVYGPVWYKLFSGAYYYYSLSTQKWNASSNTDQWAKENLTPLDFIRYAKNIGATDLDYHAAPVWEIFDAGPEYQYSDHGEEIGRQVSVIGKYKNLNGTVMRIVKFDDGTVSTVVAASLRPATLASTVPSIDSVCEIIDNSKISWDRDERRLIGTKVIVKSKFEGADGESLCAVQELNGRHLCILTELLRPVGLADAQLEAEKDVDGFIETDGTAWDYGSIPPVGSVCEGYWPSDTKPGWIRFTVTLASEGMIVLDFGHEGEERYTLEDLRRKEARFRIIQHPAQVPPEDTKPAEWDGKGMPPVGAVVEIAASTKYLTIDYPEGTKVKIYAHFSDDRGVDLAAFIDAIGKVGGIAIAKCFRPLSPTPEQIAKEDRSAAVSEICSLLNESMTTFGMACAVYDAVYRKPA